MKSLISFFILNLFYLTNGQKNICKSQNSADSCMQKLLLIGDPKYVFPEDKDQMNRHCRAITAHEKCIKNYASKCLSTFPRQVTNVFAYGVAKTNKGYCSNQRRKDSFIAIGKCANKLKPNGDKCMRTYIDRLQGIENYEDKKMKIPLACCNYFLLKDCVLSGVQKEGPPLCTESSVSEIEKIIDGYANDGLSLICSDYTEDSDKCVKLVEKTPKRLASQRRPKSLLPPFISLLSDT